MEDDMNDRMNDILAHSLEGNALGVKDAINDLMAQRAMDAIQSMKVDVAQSIYGNYASDDDGPNDPDPEEDVDYDEPEDDDYVTTDDEFEDLFAEIEDLTGEEEDSLEEPTEGEDDEDV